MESGLELNWSELEVVATPHEQPRSVLAAGEPRRVNNLTLIDGKTFLATALAGDIAPPGSTDVGLFHQDTRFLSHWELRVNGHRAVVLSAANQQNILAQIELTTTNILVRDNLDLPENTVHIHREQLLVGQFLDRLTFHNFNLQPVVLTVELHFDADFVDVFQVRGMMRAAHGTYFEPVLRPEAVVFAYLGRDELFRQTTISFSPAPRELKARQADFELRLGAGEKQTLLFAVNVAAGPPPERTPTRRPVPAVEAQSFEVGLAQRRHSHAEWARATTSFETSDDLFTRCLATAASDFFSLRIPFALDPLEVQAGDPAPGVRVGEIIAAGIPWFATIFGRDSLIAGYQSLLLHPQLAKETLRYLARHQGTQRDDWRDEEPGKILHELREGEMTRAGEMPHSPYYGSVDATPLFLIVLDETYNWTGDDDLLNELLPAARRALEWLDQSADLDGDGFVEYLRRSPQGLANQGWKDSWDAYLNREGVLPKPPLALCEVQGYCYDARYRLSRLLRTVGDAAGADRLRRQATELSHRFERQFWLPEQSYYACALDAEKQPQRAVTSNAGHLLWSRIIGRERARQVARRLMRADMYSGWGIRTLSADEPTFNPLSYHRGSVWPHDNSLIAQGLAFYDFKQPLLRLITGLFQAANYFRDQRLPELFVGVQRGEFDQPVNYPVSCSPQAWASGAWFLLLTAALGLRPNASRHELRIVNPMLPEWLGWLRLHHLRIGRSQVSLEFNRRGARTFCNVLEVQGERLAVSVDFTPKPGGL
ncbi:MAG TPA: glycogen debranching N-terminal domain-containing protein [Terriglobales bacterium]|nr:glycogen debranching N-terminal domain-containing protein [Terriglobales bacterium]